MYLLSQDNPPEGWMKIRSKVTRLPGSSVLKYYFSFSATQI
jgi:hypothetical protein